VNVGAIEVTPLRDGSLRIPEPEAFPAEGTFAYEPHRQLTDGRGAWKLPIGAFVAHIGDRIVLLDAGAGSGGAYAPAKIGTNGLADDSVAVLLADVPPERLDRLMRLINMTRIERGDLPSQMRNAGIAPGDVTDVVLSHLHFDHIGWASQGGEPYFPNATYHCERHDAQAFLGRDPIDESLTSYMWGHVSANEKMAPVLSQLELFDRNTTIAPGIDVVFAPGHTPGNTVVVLSSGGERAMVLGDAVHCPLELMDEDFAMIGDMDPALATKTREMVRRSLEDGLTTASSPHFPGLQFGRLLPGMGIRQWRYEVN
jgi:glyoxylase-like metal-dependent hydrolase (beta-lactamase superfamily II)